MIGEYKFRKVEDGLQCQINSSSDRTDGIPPRIPLIHLLGQANHVVDAIRHCSNCLASGDDGAKALDSTIKHAQKIGLECVVFPLMTQHLPKRSK